MSKKNTAQPENTIYVVGKICSFVHHGKHYTEGMEITAAVFPKKELFDIAVKQEKIVPQLVTESETVAEENTTGEAEAGNESAEETK